MSTPTRVEPPEALEFMIRVKLPSAAGFSSGPSGDTEYDEAYKSAIFDAKPQGFEVRWPRANEKWAVDSEGRTIVPLYVSDHKSALCYYADACHRLEKELKRIRDAVGR